MARLLDQIVGHDKNVQQLIQLKAQNRWPHAFLFTGPTAIGKHKVALAFAQTLICEKSPVACGVCGPCLRVEKQQSENLMLVRPDTSLAKPVIKVERIREILDSLSLASWQGSRVVIIDDAHRMNPQASNALLKTLEEPFANVYFFLIGPDVQQFLPTIRSRCQIMNFHALTANELKKIKPGLAEWAYLASRGQVDRLLQLASPDGIEKRTEAYQFLETFFLDNDFLQNSEWRLHAKDKAWSLSTLGAWLQIVNSIMVAKHDQKAGTAPISIEHTTYFAKLKDVSFEKLAQLADFVLEAERDILGNADPVLIFEKMWVHHARMG